MNDGGEGWKRSCGHCCSLWPSLGGEWALGHQGRRPWGLSMPPQGQQLSLQQPTSVDLGYATQPWSRWRLLPRLHNTFCVAGSCVLMDGSCDSAGCHPACCAFKNASTTPAASHTTSYLLPAHSLLAPVSHYHIEIIYIICSRNTQRQIVSLFCAQALISQQRTALPRLGVWCAGRQRCYLEPKTAPAEQFYLQSPVPALVSSN